MIYDARHVSVSSVIREVWQLFHAIYSFRSLVALPSQFTQLSLFGFTRIVRKRWSVVPLVWTLPSSPRYKLNVDGSSLGNPGPSGGGMILRSSHGCVVMALSESYGVGGSFRAEVLALLHGLQYCARHLHREVDVESDSLLLVTMLQSSKPFPWRYDQELNEIRLILTTFPGYTLKHVYRQMNSVADALAKLASSTGISNAYSFSSLTPHLKGLVALDNVSFPYIRRTLVQYS